MKIRSLLISGIVGLSSVACASQVVSTDEPETQGVLPYMVHAPKSVCPSEPMLVELPAARQRSFRAEAAPLELEEVDTGWRLRSEGADAGRVVAAIAHEARLTVLVSGSGMVVPIYAHRSAATAEELLEDVGLASGMDLIKDDDILLFVDPAHATRIRRTKRASQLMLMPLEVKLYPVEHPGAMAEVLSVLLLSCRGEIVVVPGQSKLIIKDVRPNLAKVGALLDVLEEGTGTPVEMDFDNNRTIDYSVDESWVPPCPLVDYTDLDHAQAVGTLLLEATRRAEEEVIVGCGGERRVTGSQEADVGLLAAAARLEVVTTKGKSRRVLRTFDERGAVSQSVWRHRLDSVRLDEPWTTRAFVIEDPVAFAKVVELVFRRSAGANPGAEPLTVVYEPASIVFVAGKRTTLDTVQILSENWGIIAPTAPSLKNQTR